MKRDFLYLSDCTKSELEALLERARVLKSERNQGKVHTTLSGKTLALIFEKASTRTRVSFEAAMLQMGGVVITLPSSESQIARGEPAQDTARVVSRYVDAIMLRTFADERIQTFAKASRVPVINGLTDGAHPVQLLADLQTVRENGFDLSDRTLKIAFVGDCASNMARSWIEAAQIFGFQLWLAAPRGFTPGRVDAANVFITHDPSEAVRGAHVVNTDVWASMGQEKEAQARKEAFAGFTVNASLLAHAQPAEGSGKGGAIVLHCLPAHRDEEISAEVLEGSQSRVWDQAENRLHAQKALLELLLLGA
jgi:ornithine carbamoyltransferase